MMSLGDDVGSKPPGVWSSTYARFPIDLVCNCLSAMMEFTSWCHFEKLVVK